MAEMPMRLAVLACLTTMGLSARQILIEWRVTQSERLVTEQSNELMRGGKSRVSDWSGTIARSAQTPRLVANRALLAARSGAQLPASARRSALLDQAVADAEAAAGDRPAWGEAWMVVAYARAIRDGVDSRDAEHALARSYQGARYLRYGAEWRVQAGLMAWQRLDPETRAAVVDEAVFLTRRSPELHAATFDRMRASPAYSAFILRWAALRGTDAS
jgi:hypothetical protein